MRNGHYIIDAHCHIYPEKIARKAAMHISEFYEGINFVGGDTDTLIRLMDEQGIDYAVVNSAAMTPHQVSSVNRFLLEATTLHADRFARVGSIHPDCTDEEQDAAIRYLTDNKFHGIKLHPDMICVAMDDPRMMKIYARCQEAQLPVLLHAGDLRYDYSNLNRLEPVVRAFPNLTVIGGHFAGREMSCEAADRLHAYDNLFADCSSAFDVMTHEEIMYCMRTYGTKKLMFGTDYPVMIPHEDLNIVLGLPLSEEEQEEILWKTAARVYKLTPPWLKEELK